LERIEYEKLNQLEDVVWWFVGLHANLKAAFERCGTPKDGGVVLDAGCGTGGLLGYLARHLPAFSVVGVDVDEMACKMARAKSSRPVCVANLNSLPFANSSFVAIFSADVICHAAVEEGSALREMHRCLAPGGVLVLNLPAYEWLFSEHDVAYHNARRYTRARVRDILRSAGFGSIQSTYWNTALFPLLVLDRKVLSHEKKESDLKPFPTLVDRAFRGIMHLETVLLKRGIALPYGSSIVATSVKS